MSLCTRGYLQLEMRTRDSSIPDSSFNFHVSSNSGTFVNNTTGFSQVFCSSRGRMGKGSSSGSRSYQTEALWTPQRCLGRATRFDAVKTIAGIYQA